MLEKIQGLLHDQRKGLEARFGEQTREIQHSMQA
jgi:hypothetical protein